jgi:hypothetical protein
MIGYIIPPSLIVDPRATTTAKVTYTERQMARRAAIKSGTALRGHAQAAHAGVIDSKCPACIELQRKSQ